MLDNQRHLFDKPDSVHYLNCADMSPLRKFSVDVGIESIRQKSRPRELESADFFPDTQGACGHFARLINAPRLQALVESLNLVSTGR